MAAVQFRMTTSNRDDIAAICALGGSVLHAIADELDAAKFTIRRRQIEQIIQSKIESEDDGILSRVLFGVASTFRRGHSTADDVLDRITRSLGDIQQEDSKFRKWPECRVAVKRMLENHSVALAAKALDISYDFERVFLAGRLLTSIRPVFDAPREVVIGSTIVQTLRLEFLAPNGEQSSISVAMDLDDIKSLMGECQRALKKAAVAKATVEKNCRFEVIIPGEEEGE